MRPEVITVIVGVATFLVAVLAILLVLDIRSRQKKDVVVKQSFGPAAPPKGSVSIDIQKDQGMTNEPPQDKNRSRFYVFGVLAAGVFGALMVKLWQLQLLSGDTYIREAEKNRTEQVSLPAIRGRLLDRKGRELVGNRPSLQVTAPRSVADDRNLVHRLSLVLGIPKGALRLKLLDERVLITANRILATDVSMRAAAYIQSHPTLFPEVSIEAGTRRYYPYGTLAAHVLGYIDRVTNDDLDKADDAFTYEGNDYIGRVGAESYFEEHLRGTKGTRTYQVDAGRRPVAIVDETPAINGDDVCLTIDLDLQRATDSILPQIIASAREIGREWCNAGALVAMDIEDGGILAMSSYPTFDPMPFTRGISQDLWDQLNNEAANTPLLNRVTSGRYPAASTFKAFGTLAGLHSGLIDDGTTCYCDGTWTVYGEDWAQFCWTHPYGYGHGYLDLEEAVNQSCDIFYYDLASRYFDRWSILPETEVERKNEFQEYLRSWGFGSKTGLDALDESSGRVPDAAWKRETFWMTPEDAIWTGGDMTNMVIGQGDLLVTPLQLLNGYAGIARRHMLKPHLFHQVLDDQGNTKLSYAIRESDVQPEINEYHISRLEEGLRRVVARNGGPFNELPVSVRAKTGTGEIAAAKETCSWFVAYAPAEAPKYAVACLCEQAGTGDSVAMQAVQHTLAAIYGVDIGPVRAGNGTAER